MFLTTLYSGTLPGVEARVPHFWLVLPEVGVLTRALCSTSFYFSDHSGTLPGVHGAPAASMSFSNFAKSTSTRVRIFAN